VSSRSREYWRRAAERDLNLRPDLETNDEEDNSIGLRFLREYEVERKKRIAESQSELKVDTETSKEKADAGKQPTSGTETETSSDKI
jgi:hypothetical protein